MTNRASLKVGAALITIVLAGATPAAAQEWPGKTTRVIVPFSAGSATDIVPRVVFEQVQANTGRTFVVENRPGGGFTIGVGAVKTADPDGSVILVHSNSFVTAPAIQSLTYDPVKDFTAITPMASVPMVLVISPDKNIKTLKQLVDLAKSKPGALNYAAGGVGSPPHLAMERLRLAAGFTAQLVPFKGNVEGITEVIAGRVDVYFSPLATVIQLIESGKLLPLAVSNMTRATALPNVPTTTESGYPNSDFDFWVGMFVPKQTPRAIVDKIHAEVAKALNTPEIKEKLAKFGADAVVSTPDAFDARVAKETTLAVELAKAAGIGIK